MKISIKGNAEAEVERGTTVLKIAESISANLAKTAICGKVDGEVVDLSSVISKNCKLEILTAKDADALKVLRHTASHILAHAVKTIFPNAKIASGGVTDDGFYYDFDFKSRINKSDLGKLEAEMKRIIKANFLIERKKISRLDAMRYADKNQEPYKIEILAGIDKNQPIYAMCEGEFSDICKGAHLKSTGGVKAFALTQIAGAYWRGDSQNKMLTRIFGTAFFKQADLENYFHTQKEASKRDHRVLGKKLELFMFDHSAQSMPYWLPRGWKLFNNLLDFWREVHDEYGYKEISSPIINDLSLWQSSGHLEHYLDNMFLLNNEKSEDGNPTLAIKPMNCPNAMVCFRSKPRSYRDLPLRISSVDVLHRYEPAGSLHGLLRTRMFRQDDAHNFVAESQIDAEFEHLFKLADLFYNAFGMKYTAVLSTRPKHYLGTDVEWQFAESKLTKILDKRFGKGGYKVSEGNGAFYGPKVDLIMQDALGREWQTGTFQLDLQQPKRFGLTYTDSTGAKKTPVVIHRVIYGSLERFIGLMIEHFDGNFPFWIAPLQVGIVPLKDECLSVAKKLETLLKKFKLRAEVSTGDASMNAKIKKYQQERIPYTLIIGATEISSNTISVRMRGGKKISGVKIEDFIKSLDYLNETRSLNLIENFKNA